MVLVMTNGVDIIVSHEITMLILMRLGVVARKNKLLGNFLRKSLDKK
jgi:hypothetical protein